MAFYWSSTMIYSSWICLGLIFMGQQCQGINRWLNPEFCCGQVPLAANDLQTRCCGGNLSYSSFESMCCWETSRGHYIVPLPSSDQALPTVKDEETDSKLSSNSVLSSKFPNNARFLSCCGDSVYDFRFYVCCRGVVRKQRVTGNTGCCGRDTYDPYNQLCCDGDILPKSNFASYCCGKSSYDRGLQVCCDGVIHELPSADHADNINCCGRHMYDNRRQLCCAGNRLEKATTNSYCCGSTQFDWEKQLCCNGGDVMDKSRSTQFCCGSKTFDMSTHMCCRDNVIAKPAARNVTGNGVSLLRRQGHSLMVDDQELLCCGDMAFNYEKEMCCDGHVVKRHDEEEKELKCCGSATFVEESEICCDGVVSTKQTRAEDCCGKKVFNVQTQVCCQQLIHNVTSDSLLYCCGSSTFDPQKETCCGNKKVPRATLLIE